MNIPNLYFRSEVDFPAQERLEKIVTHAPEVVYSPNYRFVKRQFKENIKTIEDVFQKFPAARESALQLIGRLCHESIQIAHMKRENKFNGQGANQLELEVCSFLDNLKDSFRRFNSDSLQLTILRWIFDLCNEFAQYNQKRSKIKLARDLIPYFLKIRCIESLANLLDYLLADLLKDHTDEVIKITVDCFNYGTTFDWILLHVTTRFSANFVPPLLDICIEVTKKRIDAFVQGQDIPRIESFCFIADLFAYLAIRKNPPLHAILVQHICAFFNDPSKQQNEIICIATLFFVRPGIADLISDEVHRMINTQNATSLISLVFSPAWALSNIHPTSGSVINVGQSITQILHYLPLDTLFKLYDHLIPLMSTTQILADYTNLDRMALPTVQLKFDQFMDEIFTLILMKTLEPEDVSLSSLPYLEELSKNNQTKRALIMDVMEGNDKAKHSSKLLGMCCVIAKKLFTSRVVGQMLLSASSERELKNVVAFLRTVNVFDTHAFADGIVYMVKHLTGCDGIFREINPSARVSLNFMKNIATVFKWQAGNLEPDTDIAFGSNLSTLDGHLQIACLDFLFDAFEQFHLKKLDGSNAVGLVNEWIDYMERFKKVTIDRLDSNVLLELIRKAAAVGLILIRFLPLMSADERSVVETCKRYFDFWKAFLCRGLSENNGNQYAKIVRWCLVSFIKALLQNVFDTSHNLFGTKPGQFETSEQMSFENISPSLLPEISHSAYISHCEQNCFEQLRNKPFAHQTIPTLAHSGTISSQHSKFKQKAWTSVEKLRCSLIVGVCSDVCSEYNARFPQMDEHIWYVFGNMLTSLVCPDALTSTISWQEWTTERESVPLYIEVVNKIRDLPLVQDLILLLAQNGYVALCTAIPLVKSMFAAIINLHGSTPKKFDAISSPQLEDIARLFSLFFASGIVPLEYKFLFQAFKITTHHETYLILSSLWEYIRAVVPHNVDELRSLCNGQVTVENLKRKADPRLMSTIVIPIIQLHIEELGYLLPKLFVEEDHEDEVW